MKITTLIFDYGGVIFTQLEPKDVARRRSILANQLGFSSATDMWHRFYKGDEWQATKTGQMTDAEMWKMLLSPYGLGSPADRAAFLEVLFEGEGLQPTMRQLLLSLHGSYRLAILSNASDILEEVLENKLEILDLFELVANSHRLGVAKPDPRAFELTLSLLSVGPEQVLFIDDQERNTKAARSLGLNTHLFSNVSTLRKDLADRGLVAY